MTVRLIKKCTGCKYEAGCKHIGKLLRAVKSLEKEGYSTEHLTLTVLQTDEFSCKTSRYEGSSKVELYLTCEYIQETKSRNLQKFLIQVLNDE